MVARPDFRACDSANWPIIEQPTVRLRVFPKFPVLTYRNYPTDLLAFLSCGCPCVCWAMTSGNERGVAPVLADAYAATMEPTANVAMTSMLEVMMDNRVSTERDATDAVPDGVDRDCHCHRTTAALRCRYLNCLCLHTYSHEHQPIRQADQSGKTR